MKPGKYIFFDIDGTIEHRQLGTPQSAIDAIRMLRENGHHSIVCTNRIRNNIQSHIEGMNFDGIISGTGSDIEYKGETLFSSTMPPEEVRKIVELLRKHHFVASPEGKNIFFIDPEYLEWYLQSDSYKRYRKSEGGSVQPWDSSNTRIAKVGAYYTPESDRDAYLNEVDDGYYCLIHGDHFLETVPKETTKGNAIRWLINKLGINYEDTYAFADTYADLDMLQAVHHPIAMGNGDEKLLAVIKDHAKPLLEDGLYLKLQEIGLI